MRTLIINKGPSSKNQPSAKKWLFEVYHFWLENGA
jgi:hypothetical protein